MYCWDPYVQSTSQRLEMIQRRAVRFITNKYQFTAGCSITEEMNRLEIATLSNRRIKMRLLHLYKVVKGCVKIRNANCKNAVY